MGGNALGFQAERIESGDVDAMFRSIVEDVCDIACHGEALLSLIPAYRAKKDHGDMDILLHGPRSVFEEICKRPDQVFTNYAGSSTVNGDIASFAIAYKGGAAQIDIIYTGEKIKDHLSAFHYYAHNDLGNLIGAIAKRMGFKFGIDGLSYTVRDSKAQPIGTYHFPMAHSEILGFLGLDSRRYVDGFDTLEDIFEYVASSAYFHPQIYTMQSRNSKNRARDAKRPTYVAFLAWLEKRGVKNDLALQYDGDLSTFREFMLHSLMQSDRDFARWYQNVNFEHAEKNYVKMFWNGALVKEWTSLKGADIREFMEEFQAFIEGDSVLTFNEWVTIMGMEVKTSVIDYFLKYRMGNAS